MKILFLGTGAGESWPALFCKCRHCRKAREEGKIMPGSSILIDDQYLIDAPTGSKLNLALLKANIKFPFHIFITHSHQDHFDPEETISSRDGDQKICLYINKTIFRLLKDYTRFNRFFNPAKIRNYQVNVLEPFKVKKVDRSAAVIPVSASHDKTYDEENLNYILKIKGRTILYACDTGWYTDRTWEEVTKHKYDVVILECTCLKTKTEGNNHMDYDSFLNFIKVLKAANSIENKTQLIATHFSLHNFDERKAAKLRVQGIKTAYRGMICQC